MFLIVVGVIGTLFYQKVVHPVVAPVVVKAFKKFSK